jgi:hypothetical protein
MVVFTYLNLLLHRDIRQTSSKDRYTALNTWSDRLGSISRGITRKTGSYGAAESALQAVDLDMMS